jgi:hypothetical protein
VQHSVQAIPNPHVQRDEHEAAEYLRRGEEPPHVRRTVFCKDDRGWLRLSVINPMAIELVDATTGFVQVQMALRRAAAVAHRQSHVAKTNENHL